MRIALKGGLLYDGTGAPPRPADVWIAGDRVAAVTERDAAPEGFAGEADRVIDCAGLCVSPGWIDAHSHNDFFLTRDDADAYFAPFLRQGITTQVTGNCGFSPFGVAEDSPHKALMGGGLFTALEPASYADFCRRAAGRAPVNAAPLIGHGAVRTGVAGYASRALTPAELERALSNVDEAMAGGAFGGSLGLMYEPGMYAPIGELTAFAARVAKRGGILTVHPRACSKVAMGYPLLSRPHIELALEETLRIARDAGVRLEYSHLIFVGETSWNSVEPMLRKLRAANDSGAETGYDAYSLCYGASVITVVCPAWYMALSPEKRRAPATRLRLRLLIDVTRKALGIGYEDMVVAYVADDAREFEGRTVAEIAATEKRSPFDVYLSLVERSGGHGRIYLGKYYNEAILKRLMADDLSICMTDAWVEPVGVQNGAAYQCFPNFLLLARAWGMPWEQVIHKMTLKTAERFRIAGRGAVRAGAFADVTVFDPEALRVDLSRPDFTPEGIRYVLVNGAFAVDGGAYRAQTAGRVLSMGKE